MDKYDAAGDHYCYPDTSVLKNKLNIKDLDTLEDAEREITEIQINEVVYHTPPYNLDYLKSLHKTLFSSLYDWAGTTRTIDISKGGTRFCYCDRIEPEAARLFAALEKENWLQDLDRETFCDRLAEHYCEINMLHPFREGNGRVQRLLFEHIALSAGYELSWEDVLPEEWTQANIDGVNVTYASMARIFKRIVT